MKLRISVLILSILYQTGFSNIQVVDLSGGGDFTSIYDAVDDASSGDTVLIMSGIYQLPATSGRVLVDRELHIMGSGYDAPEEGGTYIIAVTQMFEFTANADGSSLKGLRLDGAGAPLIAVSADNMIIEDNQLRNSANQGFIIGFAAGTSADTIRNNILLFNTGISYRPGINISQAIDITVSNNLIVNCSWYGGVYNYAGNNTTISNNIFLNCQYGVRSNGVATIVNNVFMNSPHGIYEDSGPSLIFNNCYFNNTTNGSTGVDPILESPDFVNFDQNDIYTDTSIDDDNFNFHLQPGSPLIDAGYVLVDFNDLDGSQNDPGIYGWRWPMEMNGVPQIPIINQISVTPSGVEPGGTISIQVIGRFGN